MPALKLFVVILCAVKFSVFSWERGHLGRNRSGRDAHVPRKTKTTLLLSPTCLRVGYFIFCELPYEFFERTEILGYPSSKKTVTLPLEALVIP